MGIEIEKKFTVKKLPLNLDTYPCHIIEQGYLNTSPAVRVRREDDHYYMTYKGSAPAEEGGLRCFRGDEHQRRQRRETRGRDGTLLEGDSGPRRETRGKGHDESLRSSARNVPRDADSGHAVGR